MYVDVIAQYLKITLYQPYENKMNIFNQVGLISVQVIGEPVQGIDETVVYSKFSESIAFPVPNLENSRQKHLNAG